MCPSATRRFLKVCQGPAWSHGPFQFLHLGRFHFCEDALYSEHQRSHISTLGHPTRSLKILRPMTLRINPQKLWGYISIWQHHTTPLEEADKLAKHFHPHGQASNVLVGFFFGILRFQISRFPDFQVPTNPCLSAILAQA